MVRHVLAPEILVRFYIFMSFKGLPKLPQKFIRVSDDVIKYPFPGIWGRSDPV